jgi:hypothetical protein
VRAGLALLEAAAGEERVALVEAGEDVLLAIRNPDPWSPVVQVLSHPEGL